MLQQLNHTGEDANEAFAEKGKAGAWEDKISQQTEGLLQIGHALVSFIDTELDCCCVGLNTFCTRKTPLEE